MVKILSLAQRQCYWKLGKGKCFFWEDEWASTGKLLIKAINLITDNSLVQGYGSNNNWDWDKISTDLPLQIALKILLLPFPSESQVVVPIWKPTSNGQFSTKSSWELVRQKSRAKTVVSKSWGSRVPTTISIF